jgi:hypothetical protein
MTALFRNFLDMRLFDRHALTMETAHTVDFVPIAANLFL